MAYRRVLHAGPTRNNIGNGYGTLPSDDLGENLKRSIAEASMRVRTETSTRVDSSITSRGVGADSRKSGGRVCTKRAESMVESESVMCYRVSGSAHYNFSIRP